MDKKGMKKACDMAKKGKKVAAVEVVKVEKIKMPAKKKSK